MLLEDKTNSAVAKRNQFTRGFCNALIFKDFKIQHVSGTALWPREF